MIVEQLFYTSPTQKKYIKESNISEIAQMVLVFGSKDLITNKQIFDEIRERYPNAYILGCSTAGEICMDQVYDETLTVTAIYFEKTTVNFTTIELSKYGGSYEAAQDFCNNLSTEDLNHLFIISEGVNVSGSKLVAGFRENLRSDIAITGGLAGDAFNHQKTYIINNDYAKRDIAVVASFYGHALKVGYGSVGGWDSFGMERVVTKAVDNVLYELDGKPVLDMYKEYLGDHAKNLPYSGVYFPFSIRSKDKKNGFVRVVLGTNEEDKSLLFGGDIPEGCYAKLMKTNFNNLIDGAMDAAKDSLNIIGQQQAKLAVLVSCVGRRMALNQMIDDEIKVISDLFNNDIVLTGFYSYGEICHSDKDTSCEFHNQTMTITLFDEV